MKVLLVDDHPIVRRGLKLILSELHEITAIGEAANGEEALDKVRAENWDVLVLDISLPGRSGFDILKELKRNKPHLPIIMLSLHSEDLFAVRSLKAGAAGYLNKQAAPQELVTAVQKAAAGRKYVSSTLAQKVALAWDITIDHPQHETLSDREFQVLRMIATGQTASEIADKLLLSVKTVSTYRTRILKKLNLHTNAEIVVYALAHQLIE